MPETFKKALTMYDNSQELDISFDGIRLLLGAYKLLQQ